MSSRQGLILYFFLCLLSPKLLRADLVDSSGQVEMDERGEMGRLLRESDPGFQARKRSKTFLAIEGEGFSVMEGPKLASPTFASSGAKTPLEILGRLVVQRAFNGVVLLTLISGSAGRVWLRRRARGNRDG